MELADFTKNLTDCLPNLRQYANTLTSDYDEVNDLIQETVLRALVGRSLFVQNSNFEGWLHAIMRHVFINKSHCIKNDEVSLDELNMEMMLEISNGQENMQDDSLSVKSDIKDILHMMDVLPDEYRRPFDLYIGGYHYYEIAEMLNLPVGTVKSRINFGRHRLQKYLKNIFFP